MAATTASLRHEGIGTHHWIVMAVALLGLALGCGYTLAMGELVGLYVSASLVCAVAVLFDYRAGAVLLVLLLPFSASSYFPHAMLGINGLNPLNLLLLATLGSYVLHVGFGAAFRLVPQRLAWLFIVPIVLAGLNGIDGVPRIPSIIYELGAIEYYTAAGYLINTVAKPMIMVAVALIIGVAAARSDKPERFIIAIALSAWLIALIQLAFVAMMGFPLAAMATPSLRSFYSPIGIHANDLGRLHLYAIALLLFVWSDIRRPGVRLFLLLTLGVLGLALLLTFSRASIAGAGVVGALFLMWKFNARSAALAIFGLMLIGLVAGDLLYARLTVGMDESADAVTAGRIDGIWLPLLTEVWKSPVWGSGLTSIMWSFPMQMGVMTPVGHAHNAYLGAVLDMGFLGLGLLLAYYWHVWKGFRALGRDEKLSPELRGLFQGATAALIAFFVTNMVGSSLAPKAESAYLWMAIGLMYGLLARRPQRK